MTKAGHALEDLISGFGPHERLRPVVGDLDVASNGRFQLARAAMDAAPELLVGEGGEPALDQIDPRRPGGGEMHVKARRPAPSLGAAPSAPASPAPRPSTSATGSVVLFASASSFLH